MHLELQLSPDVIKSVEERFADPGAKKCKKGRCKKKRSSKKRSRKCKNKKDKKCKKRSRKAKKKCKGKKCSKRGLTKSRKCRGKKCNRKGKKNPKKKRKGERKQGDRQTVTACSPKNWTTTFNRYKKVKFNIFNINNFKNGL